MRNMTVHDLVVTAKAISENEDIIKDNLELTYTLRPAHHRKLNEELHYRFTKNEEELQYAKSFELTLYGINIKLLAADE